MLESASAPKENKRTPLTGDAFKAKMAEGKARAKAKRESEASAPKPSGEAIAPHSPEPQAQHSPHLASPNQAHGNCPTCGSGVDKENLKKRKAGLQRKAQMAKDIADRASSHADLIDDE
jgi:excinuclease UvrABC ATPase subunit